MCTKFCLDVFIRAIQILKQLTPARFELSFFHVSALHINTTENNFCAVITPSHIVVKNVTLQYEFTIYIFL